MTLLATACPTCSLRPLTPTLEPRSSSTAVTAHLKIDPPPQASFRKSTSLTSLRATLTTTVTPTWCCFGGRGIRRARLSLLRNKGTGVFEDVTMSSGLGDPIASESAAWGDYDQDGRLDLFICGEYQRDKPDQIDLSRLYHNEGNGKFKNVAESAGIVIKQMAKGSAWGDYDDDGLLDLFVSVYDGDCRLYHNEGNGTFRDVAPDLGLVGPSHRNSFSTWFWDFDNDGRLDLFVNDYFGVSAAVVAHHLGFKKKDLAHPRLYRNLGKKGFADVSLEVGLDSPIMAMGANFGDVDNDGFLDVYFGTGTMAYSGLLPAVMLKNEGGRRFEDISQSSRTSHLQKGHGVSFADWDCDGDLDLFVVLGGAYPGDQSYNALFLNPGPSPPVVENQTRRHQIQSIGLGSQDPRRIQARRRSQTLGLSHRGQ